MKLFFTTIPHQFFLLHLSTVCRYKMEQYILQLMNCTRCHHTDEAHVTTAESDSILKRGKCMITSCTCKQYSDPIEKIDEELL